MVKIQEYEWFYSFKQDEMSIDDKLSSVSSSTSKNERKCPESSRDYFITRFFKDRRRTIEVMLELSGSVCFKKRTNYFFIHDNEFSHLVLSVRQFFAENDISFCFH